MTDNTKRWGATPKAWQTLHKSGLTTDLLPVVSNQEATISPDSKMKALGKTPSVYNRARQVAGIPKWADNANETSLEQIKAWAKEPDYGICIRTRRLHALDVDVEDLTQARAIYEKIQKMFKAFDHTQLPVRYRENSTKFLIPFYVETDETLSKRSFKTAHGAVEFLAEGQQFVAVGTHKSGVPYAWKNASFEGQPISFPTLPDYAFEALFDSLAEAFAIEAVAVEGARVVLPLVRAVAQRATEDLLANFLEAAGFVISHHHDGRLNIRCPFEAEHTSDSGESATQYFPAGSAGIERGHFKCLHAHCAHRTDGDFELAIGYVASYFDDESHNVPQHKPSKLPVGAQAQLTPPTFERDGKGRLVQTVENVKKAVSAPLVCGHYLAYDKFKDEVMLAQYETADWRNFEDSDYMEMRIMLERVGLKVTRDGIREAVHAVAQQNKIDSAIIWLESLSWDGIERVTDFWSEYFGVPSTDYSKACSLYFWTALAGRVLDPGCQADMAIILKGSQGLGKTSGLKKLVPAVDFYTAINLSDRDVDVSRSMRGVLLGEIEELRGLATVENEAIKAFISRTHEKWVQKFKEFTSTFPRRLIFVGTTNKDEILTDETGNRRWLPMTVADHIDVSKIERDRNQLWAEAAVMWRKTGVQWKEAMTIAREHHDDYTVGDSWENKIWFWLNQKDDIGGADGQTQGEAFFNTTMILEGALGFSTRDTGRREDMRVAKILRKFGYVPRQQWVNGKNERGWILKNLV